MEKDDVLLNISIDSTAENIWKVLTDEQAFNECFENIKMTCNEWKVGEKIKFVSQKNNETLVDEALITSIMEKMILNAHIQKMRG